MTPERIVQVVQPTDSEYLGRIEDHLEGRGIRFQYVRPHHSHGWLPPPYEEDQHAAKAKAFALQRIVPFFPARPVKCTSHS